jgi:hypothetical protein
MDTNSTVKPTDLRHDEKAARILDPILEDGKTTLTALKKVGVPRSTRYFWLLSGKIDPAVARAYACASPLSAAGSRRLIAAPVSAWARSGEGSGSTYTVERAGVESLRPKSHSNANLGISLFKVSNLHWREVPGRIARVSEHRGGNLPVGIGGLWTALILETQG